MRLLAACLVVAPLALIAADGENGVKITHYNITLVVTSPADQAGPPASILSQLLTVDFKDTPISDIADFLRKSTALNVVVAPELVARNACVTLSAKNMELGNLLKWIKTTGGIRYGWANHALYFSDKPIEGRSVTKLYDVTDLVLPITDFAGPELAFNGGGAASGGWVLMTPQEPAAQNTATIESLVELLEKQGITKP